MTPSRSVHEALLRQAVALLKKWKKCEADESSSEDGFADEWADLSEDVSAFLDMYSSLEPHAADDAPPTPSGGPVKESDR